MKTSLGIIIPTCDRPNQLLRCLESLSSQDEPRIGKVYIINDSKEQTLPAINAVPLADKIILLEGSRKGPVYARNLGLEHATEEYIAFLDDDSYPCPGWASNAISIFSEYPEITAQLGKILWAKDGDNSLRGLRKWQHTFIPRMRQRIYDQRHQFFQDVVFIDLVIQSLYPQYDRQFDLPGLSTHISTNNAIIRREFFDECGFFDVRFHTYSDRELSWRLLEKKKIIAFNPQMCVFHDHDPSILRAIRRCWFAAPYEELLQVIHPLAFQTEKTAMKAALRGGTKVMRLPYDEQLYRLLRALLKQLSLLVPHISMKRDWV